jgi:Rps23 Pro-64 3,4-dihydroxylase Tpa1-like proline 4-hydroxylase
MAYQSIWYSTEVPDKIVDIIEEELYRSHDDVMGDSTLHGNKLNFDQRNSKNAWINSDHWVSGFIWHYVNKANRDNFLYDLSGIDGQHLQYTSYKEGQFYSWHNDAGPPTYYKPQSLDNHDEANASDFINKNIETVRKLSIVMQLSHHDDYEGGNLQLMNDGGQSYFAPRKKGTIIIFDSRAQHRVLKVTKGVRKSLVGWIVGPRWR